MNIYPVRASSQRLKSGWPYLRTKIWRLVIEKPHRDRYDVQRHYDAEDIAALSP
jgi:hypothetical protein